MPVKDANKKKEIREKWLLNKKKASMSPEKFEKWLANIERARVSKEAFQKLLEGKTKEQIAILKVLRNSNYDVELYTEDEIQMIYSGILQKRKEAKELKELLKGKTEEEIEEIKRIWHLEKIRAKRAEYKISKKVLRKEYKPERTSRTITKNIKKLVAVGWRAMLPNLRQNRTRSDAEWAYTYYSLKKGLKCEFPYVFNKKKVVGFTEDLRPVGEGNIDLIDDYWNSIKGGFEIFGDIDSLCNIFHNRKTNIGYRKKSYSTPSS